MAKIFIFGDVGTPIEVQVTYIYALVDEKRKEIYVGKANNPVTRFRDHLKDTGKYRKPLWLKKRIAEGNTPELQILEQCGQSGWQEREKYWIQHYKNLGWDLINNTLGGDGGDTGNTRKFKGKSLEERYGEERARLIKLRISKKLVGRQRSQEEKDKIGRAMKGRTITWGDKISKSKMGHSVSPEQIEKRRVTMLKKTEEENNLIRKKISNSVKQLSLKRKAPVGNV